MARSNSHIILTQVLELVLPKNQNAFQFQQEIGELSKKKLEPALEKLFDKYSTPNELLQIDLVEVNIGKQRWLASGEAFVEAVVKAIEEQLKNKISIGNKETTRKSLDLANFEEWAYFLENGSFPPGTRKPQHKYYQSSIPRILEKNQSCRKELIKLLGNQPRCSERLIKQHREAFLVKLFAALTESKKNQIEAYKQEVLRLVNTASSVIERRASLSPPSILQSFWKWIFENLKTNTSRRFDEKELIIGYLANWVHIQKSSFKEGESSLRLTLRKILQESPGSFPLLVKLRKQLEDTVFSKEKDSKIVKPDKELNISDSLKEQGSRTANDKEDLGSSKKNEIERRLEKTGTKPNQEEKTLFPEDSLREITNQKGQETQKDQVGQKELESRNRQMDQKENEAENKYRENASKRSIRSKDDPGATPYRESIKKPQSEENTVFRKLLENEPLVGPVKKENAKKEIPPGKKASEHREGSFWYINNAGVVLLHTFLPVYFEKCGLTLQKQFIDEAARDRAAQLLFYLATGQEETPEYDMVLPKFLCGMPLEIPIYRSIDLSETEKTESISVLQSAIDHWGKLKKTSPDGLRVGFLQRDGKLEKRTQGWYLTVEQRSMDVLLNYLPWNLRMIKLPWMEELLRVEWE